MSEFSEGHGAEYFDELYRGDPDPWAFRTRWYEKRKRDVLLACLPRPRFRKGFEPACANGETSAELAARVDDLLCSDCSAEAVALARHRLAGRENVRTELQVLPLEWPAGSFDLIVLSELGYYLSADAWRRVCREAAAALSEDGVLVACHWRHPIQGCVLSGDDVQGHLAQAMGARPAVRHLERDFRLELWFAPVAR
ncbi:class I SAM-dependent methyltransferase [Pseudomonas sp. PDNC002]|uniref:methyltransferase domain-containing protein n=1 Tax=Pseudomonas sp. PDNC002 TaxID=2811422 RepID=UPI001963EA26|nr:class I SAM-dependent methyltransferase [Pseudomonas sp. PDNC002]QRY77834.1 class I SAM-dependent methyltransferase [Pseudomonas sp. PDNC002]